MAGLFIPDFRGPGSPGVPSVGSTARGLQLVEQGRNTLVQQGLVREQQAAAQPEALRQIEQAPRANELKAQEDERKGQVERMVFTAQQVDALKGNRDSQEEFLVKNIAEINSRKGDPQHSMSGLRQLQEGMKTGNFAVFDQTISDLMKIGDKNKKGLFSATTKQFSDGTVQQVGPDGTINVFTPDGKQVFGSDAATALKDARSEEVEFARLKSQSQETGKLAPKVTDLEVDKQRKLDFQKQKSKFEDSMSKTVSKIGSAKAKASLMVDTVNQIKSFISGLSAVYGSSLKSVPGSEAKKLAGLFSTMKANSAFGTLLDLKEGGGTLGAISTAELTLLSDTMGSLQQSNDIPEILRVLDQIIDMNQGAIDRLETAFASDKKRFSDNPDAEPATQSENQSGEVDAGKIMVDANGNRARVFADGSFEEL